MKFSTMLIATTAIAMALPMTTNAQTAFLDLMVQGPGVCQAALPAFEGQVRKRPLAIQNEGTDVAFVSCAMPQFTDPALGDVALGLRISFINSGSTAATVSCTGVSFVGGDPGNIAYVPQTLVLPANTPIAAELSIRWHEEDGNGSSSYTTVSCALPPGTGLATVYAYNGPVSVPD